MAWKNSCMVLMVCCFCAAGYAQGAAGEAPVKDEKALRLSGWDAFYAGRWRVEASAGLGLHQGDEDHSGDALFLTGAEYEIPVMGHGAVGLKLTPTFVMTQEGSETVWGAGGGLTVRIYQVKNEQRGFFVEGECQVLGHYPKFEGNSSSVNFLTGGGIGYRFKNNWHVTAKFTHLSNAGLAEENAGFNAVNLGAGFTF